MHELTKAPKNDQRRLTSVEFQALAQVPAAVQWFANLDNPRT
ncbi:Site-specific tyrosine integrase/recombinase [Pseudomonas savastanoi pv. phaseolicola]|nr:Site-specific tyrosine integrase/recombinase [Pseudomonas savastanoi pv. phaseolicola]KPB41668.1 Site-specific tyrosine integrase/recombinase [Pseudomonas savastanoi pv. phaseolicola]KPB58757.1 Site-specific tyrosine integrase/recombinase [Pseudomonas savastanoi pv. phaseolicola]KPB69483.1 Site-specific tyrosine integrase/recombinase [Pseudomonas amygdali pv. mellea]